jgi:hypothetical protein
MDAKLIHIIRVSGKTEGTITDAELSDYFGVPCVKGKSVTKNSLNWTAGTTAHFPLEKISSVIVFEDRAAWEIGIRNYRTARRQFWRWVIPLGIVALIAMMEIFGRR